MGILNNENLIQYINYVKSLPYDEKIVYLTSNNPHWITNKILLDYYTMNDIILLDGDLLRLIESHRVGDIPRSGLLTMDAEEVGYLMKAWKSQQYHRFMCHIIYRYLNPSNLGCHPILVDDIHEKFECSICWRPLTGITREGAVDMDFDTSNLAFIADGTKTCLCECCLYQLSMFSQLMHLLGDEDFIKLMSKN